MSSEQDFKKLSTSSGGGYKPFQELEDKLSEVRPETPKERALRQRLERQAELKYTAEDDARWSANRNRAIEENGTSNIYDGINEVKEAISNFFTPKRKDKRLPPFNPEEVLAHPELQGIKPVNIDPVSMAVDDMASLVVEGEEFIQNPTLAGAASMAVIAIPGKVLDNAGGKLIEEAFERNPFKEINGRKIINSDLAGKAVETEGGSVFFDFDGFPDFTPYAEKIVRVEGLTGQMPKDAKLAMDLLSMQDYNKKDFVWHHHQDGKTMMLIPRSVHSVAQGGVAHSGGAAVIKHNKNNPENMLVYPSPEEKKQ